MAIAPTVDIGWPEEIPGPLLAASGQPMPATLVSKPESALISRRRRYQNSVVTLSVSWCLGSAEMDSFETFFNDTLGNGAAQFLLELKYPYTGSVSPWVCRFLGGYEQEFLEGKWMVKGRLELIRTSLSDLAPRVGWEGFLVEQEEYESDPSQDVPFQTSDNYLFFTKV